MKYRKCYILWVLQLPGEWTVNSFRIVRVPKDQTNEFWVPRLREPQCWFAVCLDPSPTLQQIVEKHF